MDVSEVIRTLTNTTTRSIRRRLDARLTTQAWDLALWVMVLALLCGIRSAIAQDGLLSRADFEAYRTRYGDSATGRLRDWERVMLGYRDAPERDKLTRVNDFFNSIPWAWDRDHWGKRDYWATPLEMLGTRGGDCEDFAIAKYVSLVKMGVELDKLRIVYVRTPRLNVPHIVLAYYPTPDAVPFILDNLNAKILPASERKDLMPVYSFNAVGLWASIGVGPERRLGGVSKLTVWRDVSRRMREEGLGLGF